MVPTLSIVFMAVSMVICFVVPLGGLAFLLTRRDAGGGRRYPGVGRAFAAGMLAFGASQLLVRIPLMTLVVPRLPEPIASFLLSAPIASLTAGLFEETARLVVIVWLLRRFHRWVDGVAFGLGHGGLEAMVLVGLPMVNNLIIAVAINTGRLDSLTAALPAEQVTLLRTSLVGTDPWTFLLAGVERIGAIAFHVGMSVLVLWGVHRSRRLLAWVLAVVAHAALNVSAVGLSRTGASPWLVEVVVLAWAVAAVLLVLRLRPAFPRNVEPDLRTLPAPTPNTPQP
ncbi:Uncharacterized membrane protein YhfC [Raineyella antarctica]|uniref:Uncharacterized membrane protein YhfC n=1 Tax=Raineyella antarctica TaxID=1577474 RepID=A0A1G6HEL4_9ACTN|nr:YhfC family glutamic-type intramembrane protease [Raineyella antarctica]SDB92548.1 Uncharacterized membrane protein YhfC [Raineyella antarctica]